MPSPKPEAPALQWMDGGFNLPEDRHLSGPENYAQWRHAIDLYLLASGFDADTYSLSQKDDFRLAATIYLSAHPSSAILLEGMTSGLEMLEELEYQYRSRELKNQASLYRKLFATSYEGDPEDYVFCFNRIIRDLRNADAEAHELLEITLFLAGVQESFPRWCSSVRFLRRSRDPPSLC